MLLFSGCADNSDVRHTNTDAGGGTTAQTNTSAISSTTVPTTEPTTPTTTRVPITAELIDRLKIAKKDLYVNSFRFSTNAITVEAGLYYLPASDLAKRLDWQYQYDSRSKQLRLTGNGVTIQMTIGSDRAQVSATEYPCPEPFMKDSVVYIPVEFVCQKLGYMVIISVNPEEDYLEEGIYVYGPKPMDLQSFDKGGQGRISSKVEAKTLRSLSGLSAEAFGENSYEGYYSIAVPQFSGLKDKAFEQQLNDTFASIATKAVEETEDLSREAVSLKTDFYNVLCYSLKHLRQGVLSFTLYKETYLGGSGPGVTLSSYTIDFNKSKILTLNDLFNTPDFMARLREEYRKRYQDHDHYQILEQLLEEDGQLDHFYLQNGRLICYDVTPNGHSFVFFELPLKNLSDIVNKEYNKLM